MGFEETIIEVKIEYNKILNRKNKPSIYTITLDKQYNNFEEAYESLFNNGLHKLFKIEAAYYENNENVSHKYKIQDKLKNF